MQMITMRQRADRVLRFVIVQFIALVGWIIVQSFFSLSSLGSALPFALTIVIEAVWWIATLGIMLLLFIREHDRFVQSVLDLEEANRRLRQATNQMLAQAHREIREQSTQEEKEQRS